MLANIDANELKFKKEQERAEKRRIANATKQLRSNYDKIEKIKWYYDRYTYSRTGNGIYLYIGQNKSGFRWIRFVIQFRGEDWLFIDKYILQIDGENHTIIPGKTPKREVKYHSVWEKSDLDFNTANKRI